LRGLLPRHHPLRSVICRLVKMRGDEKQFSVTKRLHSYSFKWNDNLIGGNNVKFLAHKLACKVGIDIVAIEQ
jgi:hypothetical protein